ATLYSNVDGTWKANATIIVAVPAGITYFFNFTNHINQSPEGTFQWSVLIREVNATGTVTNVTTFFTANRSIVVNYADVSLESTSPVDGFYDLDGDDIPFVCTGTAADNWNITLAEVMVKAGSGSWISNASYAPVVDDNAEIVFNATNGNYTDGIDVIWACRYTQIQNMTKDGPGAIITSLTTTANRTINIEFPPLVTLNLPADSQIESGASTVINFTITSAFTGTTAFTYQLLTNETGTFLVKNSGTAFNNTDESLNYQFQNGLSDVRWGIRAYESTDGNIFNSSINRTISIDRTFPVVAITQIENTPAANDLFISATTSLIINYSFIETNKDVCRLFMNDTVNSTSVTVSNNFTVSIG
ncbi:hypothetical protein LCGC14_3033080, partial [marine sediment metagenome]